MPYHPNIVHPDKITSISAGHASFPKGNPLFAERLAQHRLQKLIEKMEYYSGKPFVAQTAMYDLMMGQSLLYSIAEIEATHGEQLEALALEVVFELPEFSIFKIPYDAGEIEFSLTLTYGDLTPPAQALQNHAKKTADFTKHTELKIASDACLTKVNA